MAEVLPTALSRRANHPWCDMPQDLPSPGAKAAQAGSRDSAVNEAVSEMFRNMSECLDGEMEGHTLF